MTEPLKKEERVTISLILNQIVQQQQQHVLWISNVASGLESIRVRSSLFRDVKIIEIMFG